MFIISMWKTEAREYSPSTTSCDGIPVSAHAPAISQVHYICTQFPSPPPLVAPRRSSVPAKRNVTAPPQPSFTAITGQISLSNAPIHFYCCVTVRSVPFPLIREHSEGRLRCSQPQSKLLCLGDTRSSRAARSHHGDTVLHLPPQLGSASQCPLQERRIHTEVKKAKLQIRSSVELGIVNVTPGSKAVEFQYATQRRGRYRPCRHSGVVCLRSWSSEVADKAVMGEAACGASRASPGWCDKTRTPDLKHSIRPDYRIKDLTPAVTRSTLQSNDRHSLTLIKGGQ
ncbi:hypothetical protein FQN60_009854, partial [Etheostoma spectabile]